MRGLPRQLSALAASFAIFGCQSEYPKSEHAAGGTTNVVVLAGSSDPLLVAEGGLHIGDCWGTGKQHHTFDVQNRSARPLHVVRTMASCDCTQLTPKTFKLAPGESVRIAMELDHSRILRDGETSAPIRVEMSFHLDNRRIQRFVITGTANRLVAPDATYTRFSNPLRADAGPHQLTLSVRAHQRVSTIEMVSASPQLHLTKRDNVGEWRFWDAIVDSSEMIGSFAFPCNVVASGPEGSLPCEVTIYVCGEILGEYSWSPARIILIGSNDSKHTAAEALILRRFDGMPFTLSEVACDAPWFRATERVDEGGTTAGLLFEAVSPSGDDSDRHFTSHATVVLTDEAGRKTRISIPVTLTQL